MSSKRILLMLGLLAAGVAAGYWGVITGLNDHRSMLSATLIWGSGALFFAALLLPAAWIIRRMVRLLSAGKRKKGEPS